MGKGDKKSKRGKIAIGTFGVSRSRKKLKAKKRRPFAGTGKKDVQVKMAKPKKAVSKVAEVQQEAVVEQKIVVEQTQPVEQKVIAPAESGAKTSKAAVKKPKKAVAASGAKTKAKKADSKAKTTKAEPAPKEKKAAKKAPAKKAKAKTPAAKKTTKKSK